MQIKHYTILEGADITAIQAWAAVPNHRCIIITQNTVIRSLSVSQPEGPDHEHVFTETESALAGMIQETTEPE
jgi:hypothetical protein